MSRHNSSRLECAVDARRQLRRRQPLQDVIAAHPPFLRGRRVQLEPGTREIDRTRHSETDGRRAAAPARSLRHRAQAIPVSRRQARLCSERCPDRPRHDPRRRPDRRSPPGFAPPDRDPRRSPRGPRRWLSRPSPLPAPRHGGNHRGARRLGDLRQQQTDAAGAPNERRRFLRAPSGWSSIRDSAPSCLGTAWRPQPRSSTSSGRQEHLLGVDDFPCA